MADPRAEISSDLVEPLTNREREILKALVEGLSNQEIAARLHLALRTVKWYNTQIYSKLGVESRKAAVQLARTQGLHSPVSEIPNFVPRSNLPLASTRFVGRQEELLSIANHLADANTKLVTILAPGGMGKTRLALAVAERQVGHFRDGVFFVPLATLTSPDDIISAIADNLGFSFFGSAPPRKQLLEYLRERQVLLVLDNFEHLLGGALLVADILQTAAEVRVLTTSREQLNLQGERVFVLRGLDFPVSQPSVHFRDFDAVKLFILCAQRINPDFEPQTNDLTHLARICQLTAGMPLAIELAAGWLDTLSLEHIAHEIEQGLDILESDLRDLPERHRSVRATFERTWSHLSEDERLVFMRLSVFRGGFSLEAAQAVAGGSARHLRRSVQKALIHAEGDERFAIHELLRQFGAEKLAETGEMATIQARHAVYFADFMQAQRSRLYSSQQFASLNEIKLDFENIRTSWSVHLEDRAFNHLGKFLYSLQFFLEAQGRAKEGAVLFEEYASILQSLSPSDAIVLARARVLTQLSYLYNSTGLSEKGEFEAETAIRLLSRLDSPEDLLIAYSALANTSLFRWDHDKTRFAAESAITLARQLGQQYWEANGLLFLSYVARMDNLDVEAVRRPARQARIMFENLDNSWGKLMSYLTEAMGAYSSGDFEEAQSLSLQCLELAKAFGSVSFIGTSAVFVGLVATRQEELVQAWRWLRYALYTFWGGGERHQIPVPMFAMAQLLAFEDQSERAVEVLAATEDNSTYPGHRAMLGLEPARVKQLRSELALKLGAERFATAWAQGEKRGLSVIVAQLLSEGFEESPPDRSLRGS